MSDILGRNGRKLMVMCALLLLATGAAPSAAGTVGDLVANPIRGGAGLRVGSWNVLDLESPANGSSWESVAVEGWFQKGLDRNLVLENTLGFWQRNLTTTESGSLGEQTDRERQVYLVPTMTAVKLYPVTSNPTPLEPYLLAGVGLALGIEREQVSSTDPLVATGSSTRMQAGLGIQTGGGVEWRSGGPFGLAVGGRYQWATFSESVGGRGLYRGPGFMAGVTYRFTP
jgi:hypothetical protein